MSIYPDYGQPVLLPPLMIVVVAGKYHYLWPYEIRMENGRQLRVKGPSSAGRISGDNGEGLVIWKEEFLAEHPQLRAWDVYRRQTVTGTHATSLECRLIFKNKAGSSSTTTDDRPCHGGATWVLDQLLNVTALPAALNHTFSSGFRESRLLSLTYFCLLSRSLDFSQYLAFSGVTRLPLNEALTERAVNEELMALADTQISSFYSDLQQLVLKDRSSASHFYILDIELPNNVTGKLLRDRVSFNCNNDSLADNIRRELRSERSHSLKYRSQIRDFAASLDDRSFTIITSKGAVPCLNSTWNSREFSLAAFVEFIRSHAFQGLVSGLDTESLIRKDLTARLGRSPGNSYIRLTSTNGRAPDIDLSSLVNGEILNYMGASTPSGQLFDLRSQPSWLSPEGLRLPPPDLSSLMDEPQAAAPAAQDQAGARDSNGAGGQAAPALDGVPDSSQDAGGVPADGLIPGMHSSAYRENTDTAAYSALAADDDSYEAGEYADDDSERYDFLTAGTSPDKELPLGEFEDDFHRTGLSRRSNVYRHMQPHKAHPVKAQAGAPGSVQPGAGDLYGTGTPAALQASEHLQSAQATSAADEWDLLSADFGSALSGLSDSVPDESFFNPEEDDFAPPPDSPLFTPRDVSRSADQISLRPHGRMDSDDPGMNTDPAQLHSQSTEVESSRHENRGQDSFDFLSTGSPAADVGAVSDAPWQHRGRSPDQYLELHDDDDYMMLHEYDQPLQLHDSDSDLQWDSDLPAEADGPADTAGRASGSAATSEASAIAAASAASSRSGAADASAIADTSSASSRSGAADAAAAENSAMPLRGKPTVAGSGRDSALGFFQGPAYLRPDRTTVISAEEQGSAGSPAASARGRSPGSRAGGPGTFFDSMNSDEARPRHNARVVLIRRTRQKLLEQLGDLCRMKQAFMLLASPDLPAFTHGFEHLARQLVRLENYDVRSQSFACTAVIPFCYRESRVSDLMVNGRYEHRNLPPRITCALQVHLTLELESLITAARIHEYELEDPDNPPYTDLMEEEQDPWDIFGDDQDGERPHQALLRQLRRIRADHDSIVKALRCTAGQEQPPAEKIKLDQDSYELVIDIADTLDQACGYFDPDSRPGTGSNTVPGNVPGQPGTAIAGGQIRGGEPLGEHARRRLQRDLLDLVEQERTSGRGLLRIMISDTITDLSEARLAGGMLLTHESFHDLMSLDIFNLERSGLSAMSYRMRPELSRLLRGRRFIAELAASLHHMMEYRMFERDRQYGHSGLRHTLGLGDVDHCLQQLHAIRTIRRSDGLTWEALDTMQSSILEYLGIPLPSRESFSEVSNDKNIVLRRPR